MRRSPRRCPHPASGVAILTDDPAYELRKLYIDGRDGPLHISLHAAWDPTHYAAATIREFAVALAAHTAGAAANLPIDG